MERQKNLIEATIEAQAKLQDALGWFRVMLDPELSQIFRDKPEEIEDRMVESLAWMHAVLDMMGSAMYKPATHPNVKYQHPPFVDLFAKPDPSEYNSYPDRQDGMG